MKTPRLLLRNWLFGTGINDADPYHSEVLSNDWEFQTNLSTAYRSNRVVAATMVVALHAAVASLILLSRTNVAAAASSSLIAFDIAAPATPGLHAPPHADVQQVAQPKIAAPEPSLELTRVDVSASLPVMMPVVDTAALDGANPFEGGCDLTAQVQDALRHSAAILHQLPTIPAASRSIANAIVLWNAGWIAPQAGPAQAPLVAIRQAIEQLVATSSVACRTQQQTGPRLIYLPDDTGKTTVLAVGSGQWTWADLSADALPQADATGQLAMAQAPAARPPATRQLPGTSAADRTPGLDAMLASLTGRRSAAGTPYNP